LKNQNGEDKDYVLDSSAFLTLFEEEKGAETVQELLERAKKEEVAIFVCFVTFTEVFYITFREQGKEEARKRVKLMSRLTITRDL
jgi:predicted nucleic acid-binding protein